MINGLLEIARKLLDVADVILEDTNDDDDPIYLKKADTDKYEKKIRQTKIYSPADPPKNGVLVVDHKTRGALLKWGDSCLEYSK